MDAFIDVFLLGFLVVIAVAVAATRNLLVGVMLFSSYSLVSAALFLLLDAADVAFTEAAVGAGISTVLLLAALSRTARVEPPARRSNWLALVIVCATGAALVYGILDLPTFGAADNPAHGPVAQRYLQQSGAEIGVPNVVTSVLASYRGYDTLGEVVVIFTAGVGVLLLIGRWRRERDK
jgi:multicomponent Na+:H+ antiporter subunit B